MAARAATLSNMHTPSTLKPFRSTVLPAASAGLLLGALTACGSGASTVAALTVTDAVVRAAPPGRPMTAGYAQFTAGATPLCITGFQLPEAGSVELHATVRQGDRLRMQAQGPLCLGAGESARLLPGGLHLMLHGVADLTVGTELSMTITTTGRDADTGTPASLADRPPRQIVAPFTVIGLTDTVPGAP